MRDMNSIRQRDLSVDIVKALGIFCMVAGHCGSPFTKFICLFHMAIFFIASGYCYKEANSTDFSGVVHFIKRKFATLWFPYVLWTAIYSVLHNFFIKINVYTDNPLLLKYVSGKYIATTNYWSSMDVIKNIIKAMLLHGHTQMGGAFWFLATLMVLSIGYCIIGFILNYVFKKDSKKEFVAQWIVSIIFLGLGFGCYLMKRSFAGMNKVFSFYILFHGGFTVKKYGWSSKERTNIIHAAIFAVAFAILIVCNNIGSIALNENRYENPIFFLIVSFVGWQFLYEIAFFSQKITFTKNLLVCIGQNTLAVVILHFLCFKIVSYIGVVINQQPLCLVAAFPVLYRGGAWWVAYLFVGLFIPVCLSLLWKKLKGKFLKKGTLPI